MLNNIYLSMRKIILLLVFIIFYTFSYSQKGVGDFIIDKTSLDVIKKVEIEFNKKFELISTIEFDRYSEIKDKLYQIVLDTNLLYSKLYYISNYKIDNIEFKNIFLLFYKDKLIEIKCDKSKDVDLYFSRKYGRPIINQRVDKNIESNTLVYDEHVNKFTWKNGTILTMSYDKKRVFDGVSIYVSSYFMIYGLTYKKIVHDCDKFYISNMFDKFEILKEY